MRKGAKMKKLPEMLRRWNTFETVYNEFCRGLWQHSSQEHALYVDSLVAACTGRGNNQRQLDLHGLSPEWVNRYINMAWDDFEKQWALDEAKG